MNKLFPMLGLLLLPAAYAGYTTLQSPVSSAAQSASQPAPAIPASMEAAQTPGERFSVQVITSVPGSQRGMQMQSGYTTEQLASFAGQIIDRLRPTKEAFTLGVNDGVITVYTDSAVVKGILSEFPADLYELRPAMQLRNMGSKSVGGGTIAQRIDDRVTPMGGGARIYNQDIGNCSAGYFARENATRQPVLVTARHCITASRPYLYNGPNTERLYEIGPAIKTHTYGTDATYVYLDNYTNYKPEILVADLKSGEVRDRIPQRGNHAAYIGNETIRSSGATGHFREWSPSERNGIEYNFYDQGVDQNNRDFTNSTPLTCIQLKPQYLVGDFGDQYKQMWGQFDNPYNSIFPGDSGGTVYTPDGQILGIWSKAIIDDSYSNPRFYNCFTRADVINAEFGLTTL